MTQVKPQSPGRWRQICRVFPHSCPQGPPLPASAPCAAFDGCFGLQGSRAPTPGKRGEPSPGLLPCRSSPGARTCPDQILATLPSWGPGKRFLHLGRTGCEPTGQAQGNLIAGPLPPCPATDSRWGWGEVLNQPHSVLASMLLPSPLPHSPLCKVWSCSPSSSQHFWPPDPRQPCSPAARVHKAGLC